MPFNSAHRGDDRVHVVVVFLFSVNFVLFFLLFVLFVSVCCPGSLHLATVALFAHSSVCFKNLTEHGVCVFARVCVYVKKLPF